MATAQEYAQWIVDNQDKQGTAEFDTVAEAYKLAKAPKSASDKFTAPLKEMSVEDWKKESIAYPVLQTMRGLLPFQGKEGEQDFTQGMAGIKKKGDAIVEGVKTIAQNPAAAAQAAYQAVTERPAETAGNIIKSAIYDPELLFMPVPGANQARQAIGAVTRPVVQGVKTTAQVPIDVAKGALGRATNYIAEPGVKPTGYQVPSSRILLGDEFIPKKEMAELRQGMPISEGAIRPIGELAPAPILALSGGEIPVAGQAARAFGERIGKTYSNPYTAAADIGSMFLTGGIPILTAGRGALGLAQAGADAFLSRKGFTSLTPEQTTALNQGINPFGKTPAAGAVRPPTPQTPQTMAAAQVNPAMATTPAAQAAVNTTQAKAAQTSGAAVPIPEPQIQPQIVARQEPQVQPCLLYTSPSPRD